MTRKGSKVPVGVGVHWTLPGDVRARFGAFAAFHGRTESDLVAEALVVAMRGFSVGQRSASSKAAGSDGEDLPATVPLERRESA
jgi:hypothetical protein